MNAKQIRQDYEEGLMDGMEVRESVEDYFVNEKEYYSKMSEREQIRMLISEVNWQRRHHLSGCQAVGVRACVGDICFIDFGKAYVYEAGFQHFGLILSFCHGKAFVAPMTSNASTYEMAFHPLDNPNGKRHLLRIGRVPGLHKPSVLFVNDVKFINTARVIDIKAHIDENSALFRWICESVRVCTNL